MAEAWSAAGSVPTAEDRLVRALLLGYTLLTELAPGETLDTVQQACPNYNKTVFKRRA